MSNILREAFFSQSLEFVISQLDLPLPLSLPTFLQAIFKEKNRYVFLFHLNSSLSDLLTFYYVLNSAIRIKGKKNVSLGKIILEVLKATIP